MNQIRRILIACSLIVGAVAITRGANENESISQDIERSPEKHIVALPMCDCANATNLNLEYTFWCICHPYITVNGKLREEGDAVNGFKIISITATHIVFLCPEGHSLELQRPTERVLIGEPLLGDVPIGRPLEAESVPQNIKQRLMLNAVYWNLTNIVVTNEGEYYSVGDTVDGFTIIDNKIWFTDPMGDTAVTPFYDSSYYRKCKQSSEVESDDGDDP